MGYRSKVAFCIDFTKSPSQFIALMKVDGRDLFNEFMEYMFIEESPDGSCGCIHFRHNYWKWYDESQSAFSDLIEMAGNYDPDYKAKFARVGEEPDDTEEEWHNDDGYELDYPYVVRTVESGIDLDKLKKVKVSEDASA